MANTTPLTDSALNQLFLDARTFNTWHDKDVSEDQLRRLVDILKMGPTSANCSPARFYFISSPEAKARLKPYLSAGNADKTMQAPVCAIIGHDMEFHEHLPKLFPHTDARSWFAGKPAKIEETAFRNGTLQGAYMILAARALGLDCGPMSGFDNDGVDAEFFSGSSIRSNFLCNIGYGKPESLRPRSPRFTFEEMAAIL
ncbi:MAG: nitroreductase family protein [Alphaproteobacteria bacterium BRH_c36]|nr:MAG: nitroreductase family protein [Alphaproteobacteria bacterium BRH_c36]